MMGALQKTRQQWRLAAALSAIVSGLVFASVAHGQMPTSLSVQAERVGSGRTAEAIYDLHVGAGEDGAAFGIEYELPSWPYSEGIVGSPMMVTSVTIIGPGTIRAATPAVVPKPRLKRARVCLRDRSSRFGKAYWVEVPANGAAVIEIKGRASYSSWPGTQYRLNFSIFETDSPAAARSAIQTVDIPRLGAKGVHIMMQAKKPVARREQAMTPEIVGQTEPRLKLGHIFLEAVRPALSGGVGISQWNSPSKVVLGSVRTNRQGRFRLVPEKFTFVGEYAILAKSQARAGLSADWNCGPFF
jgi:hypothetical protein